MDGKYYYDPSTYDPAIHAIKDIWGIPAQYFGVAFLCTLFLGIFLILNWESIKLKWHMFKFNRRRKKMFKNGKSIIKSFIIEVNGKDMSQPKFKRLTEDVNAIMQGKLIKDIGNTGKVLDANNVLGITNIEGIASQFFVIWYREV
jgi:hypothetical protein